MVLRCHLGKGKVYLLLISINSYLPLMYIYLIFMIWHLSSTFYVKVMPRLKANKIFCAILGKKQLIMVEFGKCGISMSRCRIEKEGEKGSGGSRLAQHPQTSVFGS